MASIFGLIKKRWRKGKAKNNPQDEDEHTLNAILELKENLTPEQYAEQSAKFSSLVKEYFQKLYKIKYKFTYEELIEETGKKKLADDLKSQIASLLDSLINTEFDKKVGNSDVLLGQIISFEEIVSRISCIRAAKPEARPGKKNHPDKSHPVAPAAAPEKELPKLILPSEVRAAKQSTTPALAKQPKKRTSPNKAGSKAEKKQVAERPAQGEDISNLYGLFSKAYEALSDEDIKSSKQICKEINSFLEPLDEDSKSEFSEELETLEESIRQLESEKQEAKPTGASKPTKKSSTPLGKAKPVLKGQPSQVPPLKEQPESLKVESSSTPVPASYPELKSEAIQGVSLKKTTKPNLENKKPAKKRSKEIAPLPEEPLSVEKHEISKQAETASAVIEEAPDVLHKFEPPTFKHLIDKIFHKKEVILEPTPIQEPVTLEITNAINDVINSQDAPPNPSESIEPEEASATAKPDKAPKKLKSKVQKQEEPTEADIEELPLSQASKQLLKENIKDKKKKPSKKEQVLAQPDETLPPLPALDSREYLTIEEFSHAIEQKNQNKEKETTESISPFDRFLARFSKARKIAEPQVDPQELPRISAFDSEPNPISKMVDDLYEQINAESWEKVNSKGSRSKDKGSAGFGPALQHTEDLYLSGDEIESLKKISELLEKIYPLVKNKKLDEARKLWQEVEFLQSNLSKSTIYDISADISAIEEKLNTLDSAPIEKAAEPEEEKSSASLELGLPPPPPPEETEPRSYTSRILSTAGNWSAPPEAQPKRLPEKPASPEPVIPKLNPNISDSKQPKKALAPKKEVLPKVVAKPIKKLAAAPPSVPTLTDLSGLINSARGLISQNKLSDAKSAYEKALRLKRRIKLAPDVKSKIEYELMDLNVELRLAGIN